MDSSYMDYFPGYVSPGSIFAYRVDELITFVSKANRDDEDHLASLCLIGLHVYFETFFRDQFASVINIHPNLVFALKKNKYDVRVDISRLVTQKLNLCSSLGFILAEQFDFGTAKKINAFFRSILQITPFSRDEERQYSKMLADRNLIVHHGGLYTIKYVEQSDLSSESIKKFRVYADSISVTPDNFYSSALFLKNIVRKTVNASHTSLLRILESDRDTMNEDAKKALNQLRWWPKE